MKTKGIILAGLYRMALIVFAASSAFAQTGSGDKSSATLVAKIIMGFSLSLGLAGSA